MIAFIEHEVHVRHVGGIETGQIQTGKTGATLEHTLHGSHLGGVEVAHVKAH